MFPIQSVVDFGIPFVTTDNASSCDLFNMQKLAILRNRRKRPNLGDSSTSLSKRRNTSNADLLPSAQSEAPITAGPSSASTPALLSNPTAIQSTATVIHTPAANASTRSVAVGPSTPPSTSPSPKLNFFQKFTRKASRTFKKNRPAARAGNNGSDSSSSSSSSGDDAMTADTSVEPTPTRGGALRSSTIPEVAITPTSDSSRSASPAASIRTVFRVNPYTGRPAQQYDIDFLSPRTAAAAAKARRNRARSPRPIPGRRGVASAASTPTASGSFPPTRTPTTVVASSSLPAGFPTRSSSLRHSNEFPFSASSADLRADDSDLYHNGSGPSTPVSAQKAAEVPASSPTLPGSASSNYSLNKPLPGLPQEEAALPLSPAPSASDDVFYDASPVSTATIASSATIGGSSSPKTPEQAVSAAAAAAASRISLTGVPTPPTTSSSNHHQQAFMHRLPSTPVTQPVPSNSPAFGFSSPVLPEVGGDSYTIPPTPTPARATLATTAVSARESPTYCLFPHQVDNRVLEARLNQIRATVDGVDNTEGEEVEKDEKNAGGSGYTEADAVMDDSFMLDADSDAGDMEPLISSSPLQCNRESFTSVLTQTTGISFVTAAEDVEMDDVEVEDEEEEMNDSSLVDVDGSTLVAEGAAELSSDHQDHNVDSDDSYVHVGDSTLDGTTLVADVEADPSFVANMNVDEEEAEPEPATFQIVSKDGSNTCVAVHVHAADTASTDESLEDAAEESDDEEVDDESDDESDGDESDDDLMDLDDLEEEDPAAVNLVLWLESLNGNCQILPSACLSISTDVSNLPFRVSTTGPPVLSTEAQQGIVRHEYDCIANEWSPRWKMEPDVDTIRDMIKPYVLLCGLPNDDITVEFLAEGMFNKVYTVQATDVFTGATRECIFRCAMPDLPWWRMQAEVSTMELIRHHTTIPVPRIYAFDSSMKNSLELEWMLMEKIQGQTYCDAQETMSFESKVKLHETMADWVDQLSRITFDKMGAIYHDWSKPLSDISSYKVGPMVLDEFNNDLRLDFPVTRGPFASIREYHRARIDFVLAEAHDPRMKARAEYWAPRQEATQALTDRNSVFLDYQMEKGQREMEENNEREAKQKYMGGAVRPKPAVILPPNDGHYARLKAALGPRDQEIEECSNNSYTHEALAAMPKYCMRLQNVLPTLFPDPLFAPQSCALHHPDMHDENILVDDAGTAVALIDWEKCFTTPVRAIARYPKMIIVDDDDEFEEPEPWTSGEPKDEDRLEEEQEWQRHLDDVRLRETFDSRLEQLGSPFLAPRDKVDEDSAERQLTYRLFSMAESCTEEDKDLVGWEKMARERLMEF